MLTLFPVLMADQPSRRVSNLIFAVCRGAYPQLFRAHLCIRTFHQMDSEDRDVHGLGGECL